MSEAFILTSTKPQYDNVTIDCSLIYQFNTWKLQAQNMGRTCSAQKLFFVFIMTFRTIFAHNMFFPCSELVVFMYWTGKSMNNHLSYCGLVDSRISASDKDLSVHDTLRLAPLHCDVTRCYCTTNYQPFNMHLDFWKWRSWEIKVCFKP